VTGAGARDDFHHVMISSGDEFHQVMNFIR
jgi:hypothetical protein